MYIYDVKLLVFLYVFVIQFLQTMRLINGKCIMGWEKERGFVPGPPECLVGCSTI